MRDFRSLLCVLTGDRPTHLTPESSCWNQDPNVISSTIGGHVKSRTDWLKYHPNTTLFTVRGNSTPSRLSVKCRPKQKYSTSAEVDELMCFGRSSGKRSHVTFVIRKLGRRDTGASSAIFRFAATPLACSLSLVPSPTSCGGTSGFPICISFGVECPHKQWHFLLVLFGFTPWPRSVHHPASRAREETHRIRSHDLLSYTRVYQAQKIS